MRFYSHLLTIGKGLHRKFSLTKSILHLQLIFLGLAWFFLVIICVPSCETLIVGFCLASILSDVAFVSIAIQHIEWNWAWTFLTPFKAGAGALPPFMKGAMVPLPRFETCVHRFEKKEGGSLRQGFTMWLYTEKKKFETSHAWAWLLKKLSTCSKIWFTGYLKLRPLHTPELRYVYKYKTLGKKTKILKKASWAYLFFLRCFCGIPEETNYFEGFWHSAISSERWRGVNGFRELMTKSRAVGLMTEVTNDSMTLRVCHNRGALVTHHIDICYNANKSI